MSETNTLGSTRELCITRVQNFQSTRRNSTSGPRAFEGMIPRRILLQRNAQALSRTVKQSQRLLPLAYQPSLSLNSRFLSTSKPDTPTPPTSEASPQEEQPKPFVAPPAWKRRTPEWLLNSPLFVKSVKGLALMLGHNTKTQTAIRETRTMYQLCAEREVKETGFIYVGTRCY